MERLFGRSKSKKSSTANPDQPSSPSNAAVINEDEGFAIVSNNQAMGPPPVSNFYPVLKPELPNGQRDNLPTTSRQTSVGASALDGIPFTLSSKCSGGNDLDEVLARVENIAERIRNVDWSTTEYDFRLEKSVVSQDLSNSLRGLHTN